jgi:hypothetical protein
MKETEKNTAGARTPALFGCSLEHAEAQMEFRNIPIGRAFKLYDEDPWTWRKTSNFDAKIIDGPREAQVGQVFQLPQVKPVVLLTQMPEWPQFEQDNHGEWVARAACGHVGNPDEMSEDGTKCVNCAQENQ